MIIAGGINSNEATIKVAKESGVDFDLLHKFVNWK